MKFRFHQAEGFTNRLIDETVDSVEALDALAKKASRILTEKSIGYYKCDLYCDDIRLDRFDLCPSKGSGVDDCGRTPSELLKARGLQF